MKKTFSLVILLMFLITSSHAQKSKKPVIDFQNLYQVQKIPKSLRDSMIRDIKKVNKVNSTFKENGKDLTHEVSASTKNISKEMSKLLVQVLENPEPALIAKNQQKIDELMNKLDKDMNRLSSKLEKKAVKDEYKNDFYDDKSEKRDGKREMREELREIKQERREEKREIKEDRREERKDLREESREERKD